MKIWIDIETVPTQPELETKAEIAKSIKHPAAMKKAETIQAWHEGEGKYAGEKAKSIEDAYRKTSLDGTKGEVVSVSWHSENGKGGTNYRDIFNEKQDEASLLEVLFDDIRLACDGRPPFFIGHNIRFDLKFLFQRSIIRGVNPEFKIPFSGRHEQNFYCTMEAWAGFNGRISQDNLCKALGIEGKPCDIDGSKVWDFVKAGDIVRVADYNEDDTDKVIKIYNKLNFIK